jgi:hypothetical protein
MLFLFILGGKPYTDFITYYIRIEVTADPCVTLHGISLESFVTVLSLSDAVIGEQLNMD